MLGLLRFVLAVLVVVNHLSGTHFFLHWGGFAVFGFYLLSGYLMTAILHESYSFRLLPFALNRFLRLYPAYYVVAVLTLVAAMAWPDAAIRFHEAWAIRGHVPDILGNVLIFPFEFYEAEFRLVPPTWSVAVELVNYFLLWLVVARNRVTAACAVTIALVYHAASLASGAGWEARYYPFYAALLPFASGACLYFLRGRFAGLPEATAHRLFCAALLAWAVNLVAFGFVGTIADRSYAIFFYANFLFLLGTVGLAAAPCMAGLFRRSGKLLGDLAYPIFLTHCLAGFAVSGLLLGGRTRGMDLVILSLPVTLAFSWFLARGADVCVEPLRDRVRKEAARMH